MRGHTGGRRQPTDIMPQDPKAVQESAEAHMKRAETAVQVRAGTNGQFWYAGAAARRRHTLVQVQGAKRNEDADGWLEDAISRTRVSQDEHRGTTRLLQKDLGKAQKV